MARRPHPARPRLAARARARGARVRRAAARHARGRRRQRRHRRLPALARRGDRNAGRPRRPERARSSSRRCACRACSPGCSSGGAFGISGAIFQSISRNALGSPDVIGFTTGSATGALVVILLAQGTALQIGLGAVAGGTATAIAVYLLALRHGVQGYRLVLVGIGVAAALESVNALPDHARGPRRCVRGGALAGRQPQRPRLGARVAGRGRARAARPGRARAVPPADDARDGRRHRARPRHPRRALASRADPRGGGARGGRHRVDRADRVRRPRRPAARAAAHRGRRRPDSSPPR